MAQMTGTDEAQLAVKKAQTERERLLAHQQKAQRERNAAARKKAHQMRVKQGFAFFIALLIFSITAFSGFILRDYRFSNTNGHIQLVARMGIQAGGSVTVDNSQPEKLTLRSSSVNGAEAYEYEIARFKNMALAKTYRSDVPRKTIANLSEGKTYYVRVRVYKKNPAGRQVHGPWGSTRSGKVRKD